MRRRMTVITVFLLALSMTSMGASATIVEEADAEYGTNVVPETVSEDVTFAVEETEDGRLTTGPVSGDIRFAVAAFEPYEGANELRVRSSSDGESWTEWTETERMDETDGPSLEDAGAEADAMNPEHVTDPVWVDDAELIEVEVLDADAGSGELGATLVDTVGLNGQPAEEITEERLELEGASTTSDDPTVISRAGWGADESLRTWAPEYAGWNSMAIVHHTAGDSTSDPDEIMRGIYYLHAVTNGWGDIGYHFVISPDGDIYEGRYGGIESTVIGGHANPYNAHTFGVSVMGDYTDTHPSDEAYDALGEVIGWKSSIHDMDPEGTTEYGGETFPVVIGHQDVSATICPGLIQDRLDDIRADAAAW